MPAVPDVFVPIGQTAPQAPAPIQTAAGTMESIEAAGTLMSWPYRVKRMIDNRADLGAAEPGYNPLDDIRGTRYESDPERFAGAVNRGQVQAIMREWDEDDQAKQVYSRSGWVGTVAGVGAGLLDPTIFLPMAKVFTGAKAGYTMLRMSGDVALAGATGSAIGEAAMYATTPDYTAGDVVKGIATSTILSGLLGAGAGALLSRAERRALTESLTGDRVGWGDDVAKAPVDPATPRGTAAPQSAGAAASDTRRLDLAPTGIGAVDITARASPPRRLLASPFPSLRRTVADLVETPYVFADNAEGIATTQGPALDRLMKMEVGRARVGLTDTLDSAWTRYRFGEGGANFLQKKGASLSDALGRPREKANYHEFKDMIDEALRSGDTHPVPEVAEAANYIRSKILDPWKERAIEAKLLPEGVDAKTAESYMMRSWNKEKLAARRPEAVERFTQWLGTEQTRKAGIKDRLGRYSENLSTADETIAKLEAQKATRERALARVETRQEEVQRFNRFAFARSERMSEPLDNLRDGIRTLEASAAPHLEQLRQIAEEIRAQKDLFPEIREADALVFRLIAAAQKIRESEEIVDAIDALGEFSDVLEQARAGFADGIKAARNEARQLRLQDGAEQLRALETGREKINRQIRPLRKKLLALRKDLKRQHKARIQKAQGGAVFESDIRRRGNKLAGWASARDAELSQLDERIARARDSQTRHRELIEKEILAWDGKSTREAVGALKTREAAMGERQGKIDAGNYKGKAGRMTGADDAVSSAVKRILASDRDLSADELQSTAQQIVDRILGSPDGRLPYDLASGGARTGPPSAGPAPRGPLAARQFMIPDAMVRDFLDTDIENTLKLYLNTMVPDVLLTERFGDVEMGDAFRRLDEDSAALAMQAPTEAERLKIEAQRKAANADLAAMRDRLRHTYGYSSDPRMRRLGMWAGAAARYDILTNLGGAVLSSTADLAGTIYRYGFASTYKNAWKPLAKALIDPETRKAVGRSREQFKVLGIAAETYLLSRAHGISDVLDVYRPQSRLERGLAYAADNYSLANLMAPWTDFCKVAAGMVGSAEIARMSEAIVKGTAKAKDVQRLAEAGIDATMARRIWTEFEREGGSDVVEGMRFSNAEVWQDLGAREAYEGALARDVDIMVITPGAEKPLMMSNPVMGLVLQYKTFVQAANERILIRGLQMHDSATAQGLAAAVVLGMFSELGYSYVAGRDHPKSPQDWVKQGVMRSGILGWFGEANSVSSKWTKGSLDLFRAIGADNPDSRYISRSALGALLGPTANKLETLISVGSDVANLEWDANDTRKMRRLLLFQNHLLARRLLFDNAEEAVDEWMGLEPLPKNK